MEEQGWQRVIRRFPTARLLWDSPAGNGHMRAYNVGGKVLLVHDYGTDGSDGWTAYIDPFTALSTVATLDAIAEHCTIDR